METELKNINIITSDNNDTNSHPVESNTQQLVEQELLTGDPHVLSGSVAYKSCGANNCCIPQCCASKRKTSTNALPPARTCSSGWWLFSVLDVKNINVYHSTHSFFVPSIKWIIGIRAALVLYTTAVLITSLIVEPMNGYWIAYFTHLSYIGLCAYLWVALVITIRYHLDSNRASLHKQPARPQDIVCAVMYTSTFAYHIIVPVVYWLLLSGNWNYFEKNDVQRWMQFSKHALDFAVIFIEALLNRIVFSWGHLLITCLVMIIYIIWGVICRAIWPEYGAPYSFLYLERGVSWAFIVGIAVLLVVVWTALVGLHWLRSIVGERVERRRLKAAGAIQQTEQA